MKEWCIVKKIVEDLIKRLDYLALKLRESGFDNWALSSIMDIKEEISHSKTPIGFSRRIWDKYVLIVLLIEEAVKIAGRRDYDYVVYNLIPSLREQIREFRDMLEKTHLIERIQLALPLVLGVIYGLIKIVEEGLLETLLIIAIALSAIAPILGQIYGLIATGILGVVFILLGGDLSSILTGGLLLVVSGLYVYIIYFTRSHKFALKMQEAIEGVDKAVSFALEKTSIDVNKAAGELINTQGFKVEQAGIFAFIDPMELLMYKARILLAHRPVITTQQNQ